MTKYSGVDKALMRNHKSKHTFKLVASLAAATICTGCINLADYESTPVQVSTSQGIVTCQLYRPNEVLWDRATDAPRGMSIKTADNVCIKEGSRRKNAR
jgi:hypothetical protein